MSFKFQLPPITAETDITKLRSYLMQMTDQLEYALNNIETDNFTQTARRTITKQAEEVTEVSVGDAIEQLKALIMKNAEIIEEQMDEISQDLHGEYTAISNEFGVYKAETDNKITANAEGVSMSLSRTQTISTNLDVLANNAATKSELAVVNNTATANNTWITNTDGYIKAGLLFTEGGQDVVGIAMGQVTTTTDGQGREVINRQGFYTTYTPQELAFYKDTMKVAYVSNNQLFINNAVLVNGAKLGRYQMLDIAGKGLVIKWVG